MPDVSHVVTKVAIFDDMDNLLIIKRSMDDSWLAGHWELPGGKVDDDEDFIAAAAREVHEETGISITHKNMHIICRQLQSTEHGVPLEIYAFSSDKRWANYEYIMADIFDHIMASVVYFDLEIFELPSAIGHLDR